MTAQYDAIAEDYQATKESPLRRYIEAWSLFRMLGDVSGLSVLDLACGEGFYTRRIREAGATSVMPAGSPIGSGQGVLNPNAIRICLEYLKDGDPDYPVIVDAGVGTASDVTVAMELGVDGVLLNTGIAHAIDRLHRAIPSADELPELIQLRRCQRIRGTGPHHCGGAGRLGLRANRGTSGDRGQKNARNYN